MAFGFLKKIAQALGVGKSPASQGGKKGKRRGKRGGGGGAQQQKKQQHAQKPQKQQPKQQQQNQRKDRAQQQQPSQQQGSRRDRGQQRSRQGRGKDRRRGPAPVNTAAGEMRPGGEISAEELKAREAAHAKWYPASFAVEPVEGKKRFHDFDLPS